MALSMQSPVSEQWDSNTDVEAQLVEKEKAKGSPLRENASQKVAFYVAVAAYFVCAVVLWILSVFLTCFYAIVIRDSEDDVAIASIPLVSLMVIFIFLFLLLTCSRSLCKVECDNCYGCFGFSVLILGLIMLLASVFVVVSAGNSSSSTDRAVGGVTAGVDFIFGFCILGTVLYLCAQNRR